MRMARPMKRPASTRKTWPRRCWRRRLGVEFDPNIAWKEREQVFKMAGKIVRTLNITQSAIGKPNRWTTVVALAVFIPAGKSTETAAVANASLLKATRRAHSAVSHMPMTLPAGWEGYQPQLPRA